MQIFYRNKLSTFLIKSIIPGIMPLLMTLLLIFNSGLPALAADGQTIDNTRISIIADDMSLKAVFKIIENMRKK